MNNTACPAPEDEPERDSPEYFKVPLLQRDDTWRTLLLVPAITVMLLLVIRLILNPATPTPSLIQTAKDGLAAVTISHGIVLW